MKKTEVFKLISLLAIIVFLIVTFDFNDKCYTVTVTDKERVVQKEKSRYLIYCEDENGDIRVFENTDCMIRGKLNSSDYYASIKENETYKFTVVGFRIPVFSCYENIIKIEKESKNK